MGKWAQRLQHPSLLATAAELLHAATAAGMEVFEENGLIRVRGGNKNPELLQQLRERKSELLAALQAAAVVEPSALVALARTRGLEVRLADQGRLGVRGADKDPGIAELLRANRDLVVSYLLEEQLRNQRALEERDQRQTDPVIGTGPAGCEATLPEAPAPDDASAYFSGPELAWMAANQDDVTARQMARLYQLAEQGGEYERHYLRKAVAEWRRAPYHLQRMTPVGRQEGAEHGPGEEGTSAAGQGGGDEEGAGERGEAPGAVAAPAGQEAAAGPEPAAPDRAAGVGHGDEPQDPLERGETAPAERSACIGCGNISPVLLIRHNAKLHLFFLSTQVGGLSMERATEVVAKTLRITWAEAAALEAAAKDRAEASEDGQSGWWCVPCLRKSRENVAEAPGNGTSATLPAASVISLQLGQDPLPPQDSTAADDPALKEALAKMLQAFPKGEGQGEAPPEFTRTKRRRKCDGCHLLSYELATVDMQKFCKECAGAEVKN